MSFTFDDRRNWAYSTVFSLIGNTLTVGTGEGTRFPAAPFNATCAPAGVVPNSDIAEVVRVTGKAGDVFTVVRAQEGSITKAIQPGWVISNGPSDKYFDDLEAAINAIARKVDFGLWIPVPNVLEWNAAASNGTALIVAGTSGTIHLSPNGPLWAQSTTPSSAPVWYGATYGGGKYVVVGSTASGIAYSVNGTGFTAGSSTTAAIKRAVCYGNSLYVLCGDSGIIYTSIDAAAWTSRTGVGTTALYGAAYGNSLYVLVGAGGKILTSPNGTTWTQQSSPTVENLRAIVWGPLGFMAVGDNGAVVTSVNGTAWVLKPQLTAAALLAAICVGSTYFAAGAQGSMFTTTDFATFTQTATGVSFNSSYAGDIRALAASSSILTFAGSSGCHRYTTIA